MNGRLRDTDISASKSDQRTSFKMLNNDVEETSKKCSKENSDEIPAGGVSSSDSGPPHWCDNGFDMFTEYSTFHGVRDLSNSTVSYLRILWIVVVCLAVLFSINGCYMIIVQFIEHPVVISYFIEDAGQSLTLPDVIICPFNRFNKTFLDEVNITGDLAQYLELTYPGPMHFPFQEKYNQKYNDEKNTKFDDELKKVLKQLGSISFNELMERSAIDCRAFFRDETFCENATTLTTSTGKCFRINGINQTFDGYGAGLGIVITLPKHLYNPGINQMLNDGILVKLTEPNHGVDHDITFIPAGVHAIMPLSATQYDFINDPPRYSCIDKGNTNYSRLLCFEFCLTEKAETICNCSLIPAANPRKPEICTAKQIFGCFYPQLLPEFTETSKYCRKKCKPPCKYWKYSKTVSIANISPEQAAMFASEAEIGALKNTIILEVFYTNLDFTLIKQMAAMTPSSFIAQLGGQMSLWIGGSLVSVVQFFIYLGGCSYAKLYKAITRKTAKKKSEINKT